MEDRSDKSSPLTVTIRMKRGREADLFLLSVTHFSSFDCRPHAATFREAGGEMRWIIINIHPQTPCSLVQDLIGREREWSRFTVAMREYVHLWTPINGHIE